MKTVRDPNRIIDTTLILIVSFVTSVALIYTIFGDAPQRIDPVAHVQGLYDVPKPIPTVRFVQECARIGGDDELIQVYNRDRTNPEVYGYFVSGDTVEVRNVSNDWFDVYGWGIDAGHHLNAHIAGWIHPSALDFIPCSQHTQ